MITDGCCLSDHYAGSMINEEIFSDRCSRINIDTRTTMRIFGHDPGYIRYLLDIQFMCDPIYKDGKQSRIGCDNILLALCCRVSVKARLHIF